MGIFRISADNLHWIAGMAEEEDFCLHGDVTVTIGDEILKYDDATVSATALDLLKTLTRDHIIYQENQLLPCCGFFYIADDKLENVEISGCPNGVDWSVLHENGNIKLVLESGKQEMISMEEYQKEVFRFADHIKAFYASATPKKLPKEEFDRNGYIAFWNEWDRRRNA